MVRREEGGGVESFNFFVRRPKSVSRVSSRTEWVVSVDLMRKRVYVRE